MLNSPRMSWFSGELTLRKTLPLLLNCMRQPKVHDSIRRGFVVATRNYKPSFSSQWGLRSGLWLGYSRKPYLCAHKAQSLFHLTEEQTTRRFHLYVCEPLHRRGGESVLVDIHGGHLDVMSTGVSALIHSHQLSNRRNNFWNFLFFTWITLKQNQPH